MQRHLGVCFIELHRDKITVPILVMYGTKDMMYAAQEQMIKRWTGSKAVTKVVLEGARLFAHVDDPEGYYGMDCFMVCERI